MQAAAAAATAVAAAGPAAACTWKSLLHEIAVRAMLAPRWCALRCVQRRLGWG